MPSPFPAISSSSDGAPIPELSPTPTPPEPGSSNPHIFHSPSGSTGYTPHIPTGPGSSEPVSIIEERKRKRKLSNRDSARRSRMRKLKHMEGLVSHVTRLKSENRELANRFRAVNHHLLFTKRENQRLLEECVILRKRLTHANQISFMQLQAYPLPY